MQFRKILYLSLGALFFLSASLNGQELRKNDKGERIIVYPDGSWEYFDKSKNSQKRESDPFSYPTFSGEIAPLDNPIELTAEDARKMATRHSQLAKEAANIAQQRADDARYNRKKLEDYLNRNQQADNLGKEDIERLTQQIAAAKQTEDRSRREANLAMQEVDKADQLIETGKYAQEFQNAFQAKAGTESPAASSLANIDQFYQQLPMIDFSVSSSPFNHQLKTLPKKTCKYDYEGKDPVNGQYRKDLEKETLFTYTDERLRLYLKDKEYLQCDAFMTKLGNNFSFLSLEFTFAYPNAREAYGFIEKGSMLIVKLLNGGFIQLRSGKMDNGQYDTETELLTYEVNYIIPPNLLNSLKDMEVDSIIVTWSSGYEEYEMFNIDFFQRQIGCLD